MKRNLTFIGITILALMLTTGTFAFTYTSNSALLNVTLADSAWTTYQPSVNQPDWDSVLPEGGYGSDILVPIAAGDATEISAQFPASGEHWDKVDEQPADDSGTYVSTAGLTGWQKDLYIFSGLTGDGETADISGITVFVRFASAGQWTVWGMTELKTYGQLHTGETISTIGTDFITVSTRYDTNPSTGEAWTAEEINDLQAGVSIKGNNKNNAAFCTQVYIQADYESGGSTQGEVPQGNLYDITPHPEYTGDQLVKIYLTNTADLLKAYQYINIKVYVNNSVEAGGTPDYKILSIENGVVEFSILGGSAVNYNVSVTGGGYRLINDDPDTWGAGWTITPEFYCEVTQR